jgi:HSP20 family protein
MSETKVEKTVAVEQPKAENETVRRWRRPHYDVSENEEAFEVTVSLPGVQREAVDISIEGEELTIVGKRNALPSADWRPIRRELPQDDFRLQMQLNVQVQSDRINARIENGLLQLTLPKADALKPRKIEVN